MGKRRVFMAELTPVVAGTPTTLKYATDGHFNGGAWVDARLSVSGILQRHMFEPARLRGPMPLSDAGLVLANADGALDALRDYAFQDQPVALYEVDPDTYATVAQIGSFVSEQPIVEEDRVTLALHERRSVLNRPYTNLVYAGTGGVEGGADLAGVTVPLVLGRAYGIPPVCLDPVLGIYQVSGVAAGASPGGVRGGLNTGWTMTVYDSGIPLTAGSTYIDATQVFSTAPSAGQYRVLANHASGGGIFRLGSQPVGAVTCDVYNPPHISGAEMKRAVDALIKIAGGTAGGTAVTHFYFPDGLDCGLYLTNGRNTLDALAELMGGVGGAFVWGQSALGSPSEAGILSRLALPADSAYQAFQKLQFDAGDVVGQLRPVIPAEEDRGMPVWQVRLGFLRNYTPMRDEDLAGGVSTSVRNFVTREWRFVKAEDAAVKAAWPNAVELVIYTSLTNSVQAQAEVTRLLNMFKQRRDMFRMQVRGHSIRAQTASYRKFHPGFIASVKHPRFGLAVGKEFVILGIEENLDDDVVDLLIWG